ncbi:MAG: sugar transferase, partial [candidate division KSB1 bacterium]|nr:sugar transferase [candidate division KSB1 bacterium]
SLERLEEWLRASPRQRIQQVIFSTQRIPFGRILEVMSRQREQRLSFKLVPSHLDVIIGKAGIDQVTEIPLLEIENRLAKFWPRLSKRLFDVALSGCVMVATAPLFLILCLFRPKFYSRLMLDAEGRPLRLVQLGHGGRLSKWPWLLAILSGQLSWVGLEIPAEEQKEQGKTKPDTGLEPPASGLQPPAIRHLHLPLGVVGVAQIHHLAELSPEEKNKLYLFYVTHYTFLLDMEILFRKLFRLSIR